MTSIDNGAVLSAAIRGSINSLQNTQSQIDQTQLRLNTGLRVSSPLDNPQNYFEAAALNHRASTLTTLLDGISRSVSTITAASSGTSAITSLLEQAESVANSALEALEDGEIEAKISGTEDLSDIPDLVAISGIDNGDKLIFSFVDTDGSISSGNTVTISNGTSTDELLTAIKDIVDSDNDQVFDADLDDDGGLQIRELNGNRFEITFESSGGTDDTTLASALGFDDLAIDAQNSGTAVTRATISAQPSLTSARLFEQNGGANGTTAQSSTALRDLTDSAAGLTGDIVNGEANDALGISVDGNTAVTIVSDIFTATIQDFVDGINDNTSLNTKIAASYDDSTGKLNIRAIDGDIRSIQFEIEESGAAGGTAAKLDLQKFGFGLQTLTAADGGGDTSSESIELGSAAGTLAGLESDYDTILDQIDSLAEDAIYKGTNLLDGDTLTTFFNEGRSSSLVTRGRTISFTALGLSNANFGRSETVGGILDDLGDSKDFVENFTSSLSNDLSIIETREDFTNELITTLEDGANKLTLADQNEESANLLALQTRQLLGISALALASTVQQSTLRLF